MQPPLKPKALLLCFISVYTFNSMDVMTQLASPFMRYNLDCTILDISLPMRHLQIFMRDILLLRKNVWVRIPPL